MDWATTYGELQRVEAHWTAQVQGQQQRISTALTVNGILLAFLGSSGVGSGPSQEASWAYVACLGLLAAGLLFGALALWPTIKRADASELWLSGNRIVKFGGSPADANELRQLCNSLGGVLTRREHAKAMARRQGFLRTELLLILLGAGLIAPAVLRWH